MKKVISEGKDNPLCSFPLNTPPYPLLLYPSLSLLGGYGFVFIAQDISTGIDYALKV